MTQLISQLPADFKALEPLLTTWALGTAKQRHMQRLNSSSEQLAQFYNAILPEMRNILALLDQYPLGQLPEELYPLYWLSLSFAEVAPHIELYKGSVGVPFAFEETRFIYESGDVINI
ncbi:hypothetical protein [Acinetobacter rudis]|uniref:Uncharacterized protein n=1 Tax=Acinetobacter rudis TaxID=632955 RepID=A0AAW8J4Q5_9GAMM|nr:hypothetical protein [Acinetobacter rudis]MDQ8934333.1 hypothetical protein [Acinetobacter rudis]MDQ8952545.1 hypothetical protein [Acinetobacter rudis]MDQ9016359.1 hypothetical protein [Acinetobacter rudis]